MNKKVCIIYYSRGNTLKLLEAAAEGAREAGAEVRFLLCTEATGADVEWADALIWGTGNYYGYMHGFLKEWFDREHGALRRKNLDVGIKPRPYFCCLSASGNPIRPLPTIERLSAGMNLKKAFAPAVSKTKATDEELAICRRQGRELVAVDATEMIDLYVPQPLPKPEPKLEIEPKPEIVVCAFGSSSPAGLADLARVDHFFTSCFPEYRIHWAITSKFILKALRDGGHSGLFERNLPLRSLPEVYAALATEGKTNVVVLPLLGAVNGEYSGVVMTEAPGLDVEYGHPLLAPPENIARVAQALEKQFGGEDSYTIVCGHGSKDVPGYNLPYVMLDDYLRKHYPRVCLVTLDGAPGTQAAFRDARASGRAKVRFVPLLFVDSRHTSGDIMGEDAASYRSQLGLPATLAANLSHSAPVLEMLAAGANMALKRFIR